MRFIRSEQDLKESIWSGSAFIWVCSVSAGVLLWLGDLNPFLSAGIALISLIVVRALAEVALQIALHAMRTKGPTEG